MDTLMCRYGFTLELGLFLSWRIFSPWRFEEENFYDISP